MAIVAYQYPVFQPAMRIISAITNANPGSITTTFAHQYITGTIVRIDIPTGFGMQQLNGQTATISVTGSTTFTINVDTTLYETFSIPGGSEQYAQVVPIGEDNSILTAAVVNALPYSAT